MRINDIREIFRDAEIEANDEGMQYVYDQIMNDVTNSADLRSMTHSYSPPCRNCEILESKLKEVTKERDIYHNSVCERRNTKRVWIDNNGDVKYIP